MIFTIRPPVRWPTPIRWLGGISKTALFFVAAAMGALLVTVSIVSVWAWIGIETSGWLWSLLALLGLVLAAGEAGIVPVRLPSRSHQVERSTIIRHEWLGTIPYGFALGTGFWTYLNTALPAFVLALVLTADTPMLTAWSIIAFAAGRAAPIAIMSLFSAISEDGITSWLINRGDPVARATSALLMTSYALSIMAFRDPLGGLP